MLCSFHFSHDNFDYATPTAEFLFETIVLRPRHYEMETPQKGVRSDIFYTINTYLFIEITADGAYLHSRSNKRQYFIETNKGKVTNIKIVHQTPDGRTLLQCQKWEKILCSIRQQRKLFHSRALLQQNKSNPFLKILIVKIKCYTDNMYYPYIGVCYSLSSKDCDEVEILPHGDSKKENTIPYIRTSQKTMDGGRDLLAARHPVQYVYNKLLDESGGPLKSKSQWSEPRDKRQIYIQNAKGKRQGIDKGKNDGDLSNLLRQQKSVNVVGSIVIKKNCYF